MFQSQLDHTKRLNELQIQEQEYKTETARIALEGMRLAIKTDRENSSPKASS
jgi:hypothetical protein